MPNPFRLEDSFAYLIYRTARLLRYKFTDVVAHAGLDISQEQFFILQKLSERPEQSQTELCDQLFADRPNITRMLATMEAKGWLRRSDDPADARKARVALTAEGKETLRQMQRAALKERKRLFKGLTKNDLEELRRIVDEIAKNM